jgi:hypothetical protein
LIAYGVERIAAAAACLFVGGWKGELSDSWQIGLNFLVVFREIFNNF